MQQLMAQQYQAQMKMMMDFMASVVATLTQNPQLAMMSMMMQQQMQMQMQQPFTVPQIPVPQIPQPPQVPQQPQIQNQVPQTSQQKIQQEEPKHSSIHDALKNFPDSPNPKKKL
jgi:hypothetical protein